MAVAEMTVLLDNQLNTIPKQTTDWSLVLQMLGQFFFLIVLFGGVIFLAVFVTRYIGSARYANKKSKNMQIVESLSVGFQNMVQLIKVGDQYYLIGTSKERIQFLSEVDSESIQIDQMQPVDLKTYLENQVSGQIKKWRNKD